MKDVKEGMRNLLSLGAIDYLDVDELNHFLDAEEDIGEYKGAYVEDYIYGTVACAMYYAEYNLQWATDVKPVNLSTETTTTSNGVSSSTERDGSNYLKRWWTQEK